MRSSRFGPLVVPLCCAMTGMGAVNPNTGCFIFPVAGCRG